PGSRKERCQTGDLIGSVGSGDLLSSFDPLTRVGLVVVKLLGTTVMDFLAPLWLATPSRANRSLERFLERPEVAHGYLCLTSRCAVTSGRGCFYRDEGYCPCRNEERAREGNARSAYRACTGFHLATFSAWISSRKPIRKFSLPRAGQYGHSATP